MCALHGTWCSSPVFPETEVEEQGGQWIAQRLPGFVPSAVRRPSPPARSVLTAVAAPNPWPPGCAVPNVTVPRPGGQHTRACSALPSVSVGARWSAHACLFRFIVLKSRCKAFWKTGQMVHWAR